MAGLRTFEPPTHGSPSRIDHRKGTVLGNVPLHIAVTGRHVRSNIRNNTKSLFHILLAGFATASW